MTAPTVRQLDVLAAVRAVWRESKHAPTVRELGLLLDLSAINGVHQHLRALRSKGLVSWTPLLARTLALTDAGAKALQSHRPSET